MRWPVAPSVARAATVALLATTTLGCGDDPVAVSQAPSIALQPQSVNFGSQVGATIQVRAVVRGFGPAPEIRWTSLHPSIVVENVREGGAVADLRSIASVRSGGGVEVRVAGTATRADTVAVTVFAASRRR